MFQNFDYLRNSQQLNGLKGGISKHSGMGKRAITLDIGNKNVLLEKRSQQITTMK